MHVNSVIVENSRSYQLFQKFKDFILKILIFFSNVHNKINNISKLHTNVIKIYFNSLYDMDNLKTLIYI